MKNALLTLAVLVVYALHQDFWFWRSARPLVFGFVPIGLFYHAAYSVLAAVLMWLLVTHAWPSRLEQDAEPGKQEQSLPPTWGDTSECSTADRAKANSDAFRCIGGIGGGVDEQTSRDRSA